MEYGQYIASAQLVYNLYAIIMISAFLVFDFVVLAAFLRKHVDIEILCSGGLLCGALSSLSIMFLPICCFL